MANFVYEAKKSPTEIVKGALLSESKSAAIQKLSEMGYYILSIGEEKAREDSAPTGLAMIFGRVRTKDITNFTRQLSDLLESGLTIVKALHILSVQTENKRLKAVISDLKESCVSGSALSTALAAHKEIFSYLYVSMVRSGETGGALENVLRQLSEFYEKRLDLQTKVRTALAYPIVMASVGVVTILVLVTFVIPKMAGMFSDLGQALPIPTRILMWVSSALINYWWFFLAVIIAVATTLAKAYKSPVTRSAIDRLILRLPVAGDMARKVEIARFSRTLATLLRNGVPILEALSVVSETMGNTLIRGEIDKACAAVREGSALGRSFSESSVIPLSVTNMISIGEESGQLEKALFKVAETYERESDDAIKVMMSLLEPVLILTLGVIVGFIVISMLLPIFEINFLVK